MNIKHAALGGASMCLLLVLSIPAFATYMELDEFGKSRQTVAQNMVEQTISMFEDDPHNTISTIHDPDDIILHDNEVYTFIIHANGTIIAHGATPNLTGMSVYDMDNINGENTGVLFENISPHGWWLHYHWPADWLDSGGDPHMGYLKTKWGHVFGAGMRADSVTNHNIELTEHDRERQRVAQDMVNKAIELFYTHPHTAISMIHDKDNTLFHDAEIYVTILDVNGTIVADGNHPGLVGAEMEHIRGTLGTYLGDLYAENVSIYGRWIDYYWTNPVSGQPDDLRLVWVKTHGEYMFAAGIYPESPDTEYEDVLTEFDTDRQKTVYTMLDNAIQSFGTDTDMTVSMIHDTDNILFHDAEIYPVISDIYGTVIAHGFMPEMAGQNLYNVTDGRGSNMGELFVDNAMYHGTWVEYYWPNPATRHGDTEKKTALLVNRGGYTFAAGIYPDYIEPYQDLTPYDMERRHLAQSMVEHAISSFQLDPYLTIDTIHDNSNNLYRDGEIYVSIVHENGTVMAHGQSPHLVGTEIEYIKDARGSILEDIYDENRSVYGTWVEYYWPNPVMSGSNDELYLAWIKSSSDYVFSSGIYPELGE